MELKAKKKKKGLTQYKVGLTNQLEELICLKSKADGVNLSETMRIILFNYFKENPKEVQKLREISYM